MYLGIDIGGTAAKLGLLDDQYHIFARREVDVRFDGYQTPILETVRREARRFLTDQGAAVAGIGVSATGQVDVRTGVVIGTNGKIPGYEGTELKAELEAEFRVPVWALNDANAAALGESVAGAGAGAANMIMVTIGTGVGGGIVVGGRLLNGSLGIAGEIGHFTLYQDGIPCACGKTGCFECYASTTALVEAARRATGLTDLDGRRVFALIAEGNAALRPVLEHWLDDIAAGITGLVHIFNPELVLIGGGVSAQKALLIEPLRARVLAGAMPRFAEHLRLEAAALGNDAGLIGAVIFCRQRESGNA